MGEKGIKIMDRMGLPGIFSYEQFENHGSVIKANFGFSPTADHSELFVEMTRDENPIHRKHPEYGEAVSPGFLQTAVSMMIMRDAMREGGLNPLDYPYSRNTSRMDGVIVTGFDYDIEAVFDIKAKTAKAKISNPARGTVFELEKRLYAEMPENLFPGLNRNNLVHSCVFVPDRIYGPLSFGHLIGSASSESNLYAMAASSSAVYSAKHAKALALEQGLMAAYTNQDIAMDVSSTLDLSDGIFLELYLAEPERFGKPTKEGKPVDMWILAKDFDERILYV